MTYHQLTSNERYMIAALRKQGLSQSEIGANLGRHRSTICRELKRNASRLGHYRPSNAIEMTSGRRARSRRNLQFDHAQFKRIEDLLREYWSPEQISGHLRREREFLISHETIYRYVWNDLKRGGTLHTYLRGARKQRRKRYGAYDSRGKLAASATSVSAPLASSHALNSVIGKSIPSWAPAANTASSASSSEKPATCS